ncbi:MAG: S49 family peptidase, partial [candidate division WOR-3 bacterium]
MGLVLIFLLGLTPQMPLSIATTDDGLSLFANPAGLGANQGWEFYYLYNFYRQPLVNNSSFVLCLGQLAGFIEPRPLRYGAALGLKEDNILAGVRFVRDSVTQWSLGAMVRPWGWLSLGGVWQGLNQDWGRVGVGLGLRPIGPRLTFFTEAYLNPVQPFVGFQVEPVSGVQVATRFKLTRDEFNFCAKMAVNLERFGLGAVGANAPREAGGYLRISEERHRNLFLEPKRFLRLELSLPVVEEKPGFSLLGMHQVRTTYELLKVLSRAKEERSIKGMVLKLKSEDMSFAQAQELKKALTEFQAEGKWLWVYAQNLGMLGYYIAAGANRIILHPMGGVIIPGVATQSIFLKGALEKLGIKPEVHRHGKYKSAVEVFTEESLSVPNREQLQALVDGLYEEFIQGAIAGRKIKEEQMESLVGIAFFSAEEAKNAGLIDTIGYEDELDSLIKKEFRGYQAIKEQGIRKTKEFSGRWDELGKIAVIYAAGSIVQGESGTNFLTGEKWVGSTTICRALCEAREDKKVKGIVLRVDSPGGDGVASDIIWREIELTRKKKPVVVSMGGMAASGGYYISCNADKIFALPGTVTGSIGVFDIRM